MILLIDNDLSTGFPISDFINWLGQANKNPTCSNQILFFLEYYIWTEDWIKLKTQEICNIQS